MEYPEKEVLFDKYCKDCLHKDLSESDDPCRECLTVGHNTHSHKPVNFVHSREKTTP